MRKFLLFLMVFVILLSCGNEENNEVNPIGEPYFATTLSFLGPPKVPTSLETNFFEQINSNCLNRNEYFFNDDGLFTFIDNCSGKNYQGKWELLDDVLKFELDETIVLAPMKDCLNMQLENSENSEIIWNVIEFNDRKIELRNNIELLDELTQAPLGIGGHRIVLEK